MFAAENVFNIAGDLALLVDTNHPMIHPEFERGLEWAKKALQANGSFCLQVGILLLKVLYKSCCLGLRSIASRCTDRILLPITRKPR